MAKEADMVSKNVTRAEILASSYFPNSGFPGSSRTNGNVEEMSKQVTKMENVRGTTSLADKEPWHVSVATATTHRLPLTGDQWGNQRDSHDRGDTIKHGFRCHVVNLPENTTKPS